MFFMLFKMLTFVIFTFFYQTWFSWGCPCNIIITYLLSDQCTIVFSGTILGRIYRRASVHSYACRPVPRVRQGCPDMSRAGYIIRIRIRISISDS